MTFAESQRFDVTRIFPPSSRRNVDGRRVLSTDNGVKVLERLAVSEKTSLIIERESDGKMRVTSASWDGAKVILKGQVLEVRNVDGRLYVARCNRFPNDWDPVIPPYDPYGPDEAVTRDASDEGH